MVAGWLMTIAGDYRLLYGVLTVKESTDASGDVHRLQAQKKTTVFVDATA